MEKERDWESLKKGKEICLKIPKSLIYWRIFEWQVCGRSKFGPQYEYSIESASFIRWFLLFFTVLYEAPLPLIK